MECLILVMVFSIVWICIQLLTFIRKTIKFSRSKIPPGPIPLPLVGNILKLGSKPYESLAQLANTYGPLMTLQLGRITTIVASSPEMAKEILQKNDQAFAHRTVPDAMRVQNHHDMSIAFSQPCAHWRNSRKICNAQMLSIQKVDAYQSLRRQKVQDLLTHVSKSCRAGLAVDIGKAAFTTASNVISNTLFSIDLIDPNSELVQEFKDLVWGVMTEGGKFNLADYFPVLRLIDPQGVRGRMETHFVRLLAILDGIIKQRLQSRASHAASINTDVLEAFLNHSEVNSSEFSLVVIKHLFLDLFTAGTDPIAGTLEWAMAELLRNPNIMSKARAELEATVDQGRAVEEWDIPHLPYLQAIVKETLRLHPGGPLLVPYKVETDIEIQGFTVPKNAKVLVNVWAIGRDSSIWENPNLFFPERFLGSEIDVRGRHFELIPFGSGRRICPGLSLGLKMVHLMLASLIHSFEWKLEDGMIPQGMDMEDKLGGLTLQKAKPLLIIPIKV